MAEHPPGPWTAKDNGEFAESCPLTIYAADGYAVCAVVGRNERAGETETPPEDHELAALIIAAPDMLAALRTSLTILSGESMSAAERVDNLRAVIAAIAKAEGA